MDGLDQIRVGPTWWIELCLLHLKVQSGGVWIELGNLICTSHSRLGHYFDCLDFARLSLVFSLGYNSTKYGNFAYKLAQSSLLCRT